MTDHLTAFAADPSGFAAAPDHDAEHRPYIEDVDGLDGSETIPAEDSVGWDIHFGARLTFADDLDDFNDGRGLHYTLSVGPDMPPGALVIKTVTPRQLRRFAEDLLLLARRAEDRAEEAAR